MEIYIYIAIIALSTAFTRFVPFIVFYKYIPKIVSILGIILPPSLIAMIFIYACKDIVLRFPDLHEIDLCNIVGIIFALTIHSIFKNILLSIIGSTIFVVILQSEIF
ncbi:hypothetical protein CQA66_02650 [Helicobacter aurati]|uniref:Branched-chain amino acid transporter AzlD n=1 Tax=Helicobacter aurati TaxID=137778 RepID=A0A3D8J8G1_9HELI|nr:AzlD domain-containing protein [Helicobacter aurati]RDU73141.1 hypothetical protein CQA66_02650 [Helicobacter aurati]